MSDREYFNKRATAERRAAMKATDTCAARAHLELAREYEWRAATEPYQDTPAPTQRLPMIQ